MEVNLTNILLGILIILTTVVYWLFRRQDFFKRLNIPYVKSWPLFGAFGGSITKRVLIYQNTYELYNAPEVKNQPFFGIFVFHKPGLMITEPELIKRILVKDFASFSNRYTASDDHDPIGNFNLLTVKNPLWRTLRSKISPFFSSGHLKTMYYLVDKIGTDLNRYIHDRLDENERVELDVRDLSALYSTDVIASCAYGVEANSLKNPDGEFRIAGRAIFERSLWRGFERTSLFMIPQLMKIFHFKTFSSFTTSFIQSTIAYVMSEREKNRVKRNDLIDTLLEIKETEATSGDGEKLTMDMLMAQAAVFFSAGFETSSATQSFALYEIARNEEVQDRLRSEIRDMLVRSDGIITYDALMNTTEMPYLHQVVHETLRLYPVLPVLDRECINPKGYSLEPFGHFIIPHGMPIYIPTYAIQRDERFFPDPLKFDPERFSKQNIEKILPFTNLPFGNGPRNCVGERFGLMQVKTGLVKVLKDFRVEPKEAGNTVLISQADQWLKLVKDPLH